MNIKEGQDMKKHMYLLVCTPHIVECTYYLDIKIKEVQCAWNTPQYIVAYNI